MAKINVLDTSIANMIAAGEVVERPSSVVKELVENSIDAGAKHITVEIKNGGMSYIRVTDDGSGIEAEDVRTAFLPHATSKIKTSDDLNKIYTLGFRGEALASIAAVAKVEIYTKTKDAPLGRMLSVEGGVVTEETDAGCSDGTTIIVRNLFYNTPARMKFLKKDATEASYVSDVINKIILGNPKVSIKYIGSSRQLNSAGDGNLKSGIFTVYGKDYLSHLIDVNYSDENVKITGCIGNSSLSRKNRNYQTFFINGRNIMSKTMSLSLGEAFKNTVMVGQFPFAVLNVEISTAQVDVNVHPTKMEVRFSDDRKIFDAVYWACKNALNEKKHVPEMRLKNDIKAERVQFENAINPKNVKQTEISFLKDAFVKDASAYIKKDEPKPQPVVRVTKESLQNGEIKASSFADDVKNQALKYKEPPKAEEVKPPLPAKDESKEVKLETKEEKVEITQQITPPEAEKQRPEANVDFRIAGQIFSTYIIVEKGDEMRIIDQHAAHERLYFEQFLKDLNEGRVYSQMMLVPLTLNLTPIEFNAVMENMEFFKKVGFDIDEFGDNVVIIREVPETLVNIDLKDLMSELIDIITKTKGKMHTDAEVEALHTMACKRAIKGNRTLTMPEMEKLVSDILSLENINTCPHGRPIEIKMTKKELEKNFKRIV